MILAYAIIIIIISLNIWLKDEDMLDQGSPSCRNNYSEIMGEHLVNIKAHMPQNTLEQQIIAQVFLSKTSHDRNLLESFNFQALEKMLFCLSTMSGVIMCMYIYM